MAVPKRKLSRANTRARRSQWKATPVPLTTAIGMRSWPILKFWRERSVCAPQ